MAGPATSRAAATERSQTRNRIIGSPPCKPVDAGREVIPEACRKVCAKTLAENRGRRRFGLKEVERPIETQRAQRPQRRIRENTRSLVFSAVSALSAFPRVLDFQTVKKKRTQPARS